VVWSGTGDAITAGISFKTQALYVGIFVTRYLDLFFRWVSLYNSLMKVIFIASSVYILYLMKAQFRFVLFRFYILLAPLPPHSLQPDQPTTPQSTPSASNTSSAPAFSSRSFSITASLPPRYSGPSPFSSRASRSFHSFSCYSGRARRRRLRRIIWRRWACIGRCISRIGFIGAVVGQFGFETSFNVITLLCISRYFTEGLVDPIAVTAGIVQTGLYLDFFYVYFTKCVLVFDFDIINDCLCPSFFVMHA